MMTAKPDGPPNRIREATRDKERLTEDEMARRKLGPRGVPNAPDTATMTRQNAKNVPKRGAFDGHTE
jgi:hypothetical protein